MIQHQSVLNLIAHFQTLRPIGIQDTGSLVAPIAFDVSVYEIFSTSLFGASLHILPHALAPLHLSHIYCPPALLTHYLQKLSPKQSVTRLLTSVEPVEDTLLCNIHLALPNATVVNAYGPTETTIFTTSYTVEHPSHLQYTPIGRPIANTKIYILNSQLQPLPIGCIGEIYISGIGLATGYLNQPTLTAEKFISNPFCDQPPYDRLYRSGDLGRFWPDGNIEFIGRLDHQVKIRGFRVECGEVEMALLEHSSIQQAAVIACTDSAKEKYLAAYFVAKTKLNTTDVRIFLQDRLPYYMIPNMIIPLDTLPLTSTGKVDRQQLPKPAPNAAHPVRLPQTPTQKILADHWQRLFGQKTISIDADFFELGGHSLKALQFLSAIPTQPPLTLRDLVQHPTIEQLARYIDSLHW